MDAVREPLPQCRDTMQGTSTSVAAFSFAATARTVSYRTNPCPCPVKRLPLAGRHVTQRWLAYKSQRKY